MATVYFFEKPGCSNNTKQKKLLAEAGHQVIAKNLLTEDWQPANLRAFFGEQPVKDWFNYSAPAIKHGEVEPNKLSGQEALAMMLENPLLIRRPLMQVGEQKMAGFNQELVDAWIGLKVTNDPVNLERCPRTHRHGECGHE
jgi:nitrogenase-associated protein